MKLTGAILQKVVPNLTIQRAESLAAISNALCPLYGLTSADVYHEFIANIAHESGGFRLRKESLNFTRPDRLVAVWPSRFTLTGEPNKRDARQWINRPVDLANLVYGGRMGNIHAGDGALFIGGGFPQITGRDAYTLYTRHLNNTSRGGKFTIQQVAKMVQEQDEWAFDCGLWFFCIYKDLETLALQDNFREVVKRWNGGFVGMEDRLKYYNRAVQFIV